MPDSQRYPYKLCLIKYELYIKAYNFEKPDYLRLWFLYKRELRISLQEKIEELL